MEESRFLIITGMSGAGKTQVVRTLEDMNFFCIDNLPPALIPKFSELCRQSQALNTALVVDVRGGRFFDELIEVIDEMQAMGRDYELLYLDASDDTLIRRYKETRRRHPLGQSKSLSENIALERERLTEVRNRATHIIDTTDMPNTELKEKIWQLYSSRADAERMVVLVQSFGFKHGLPLDSDMVLDVRFLPNPFYEEDLKRLTGNDQPVADFIARYPQTFQFLKKAEDMLEFLLPQYIAEGKSQMVISIGCTGGQHRSVFIANRLHEFLHSQDYAVQLIHRDLQRKNK